MATPAVTSAVKRFQPLTVSDLDFTVIHLRNLEQALLRINVSLAQQNSLKRRQGELLARLSSLTTEKDQLQGDAFDRLDQIDYDLASIESTLKTLDTMQLRQYEQLISENHGAEHLRTTILQSCDKTSFHAIFFLHIQTGFYEEAERILARFATAGELLDPKPLEKMLEELLENVLVLPDPNAICFQAVKLCEILVRQNLDTPFSRMCHAASLVSLGSRYSLEAAREVASGQNAPHRQPLGSGEVVQQATVYADSKKGVYRPSLVVLLNNLNMQILSNFPGADIEGFLIRLPRVSPEPRAPSPSLPLPDVDDGEPTSP